ncbi:MAG: hypothetical protein H6831_10310 [Planctomycetes bacterium]|nr:hypothetical protein [Planctomycetota bacterium]MCB9904788.1 hypothetical protein [Planctomycetota bacterium]
MTTREEDDWQAFLQARLDYPVDVRYGRSRSTPVQLLAGKPGLERGYLVRLHRFFETAPDEVAEDLAAWMRAGKRARAACARLDGWIKDRCAELPDAPARAEAVRPTGLHHDLAPLSAGVLERYFAADFHSSAPPPATWGKREKSRARRSLRLGSYCSRKRLVRVHPVLDSAAVPTWFVESVLHHEFLHAALPTELGSDGRRLHHGPLFRSRERRHPDLDRALAWQTAHIARLIHCARKGEPFTPSRWFRR